MVNPIALVVEDERDLARIFAKALRAGSFEVEIVHAGDEAIQWLSENTPALVVLDLQLPGASGPEVLAHIRAQPALSEIVTIIVTAYPHIADDLTNEADCVLFKPLNHAELRALAQRLSPAASADEGAEARDHGSKEE